MEWIPVPGYGAGVLTMPGSLESYIDRLFLPGRLHDKVHDPEGILSTVPAIGTALLGVFTGQFLKWDSPADHVAQRDRAGPRRIGIDRAGQSMEYRLSYQQTIVDKLLCLLKRMEPPFLSIFYLLIDVAGYRKWALPFVWIGVNSIVIYLASEGMIDFAVTARYFFGGLIQYAAPVWQAVWLAVAIVAVQLAFLYFLFRNKIFLKV